MQTVRGRMLLALLLLSVPLIASSCSGSGGAGSPESSSAATQTATPAATPEAQAAKEDEAAAEEAAQAPEMRPENAAGAVKGIPATTNTVPIVAVANYFTELPGIDVAGLKKGQKEKFLQRINSEICSCGCKNDTLARCYVNDPRCPTVKTLVLKVYDEVKAGK